MTAKAHLSGNEARNSERSKFSVGKNKIEDGKTLT